MIAAVDLPISERRCFNRNSEIPSDECKCNPTMENAPNSCYDNKEGINHTNELSPTQDRDLKNVNNDLDGQEIDHMIPNSQLYPKISLSTLNDVILNYPGSKIKEKIQITGKDPNFNKKIHNCERMYGDADEGISGLLIEENNIIYEINVRDYENIDLDDIKRICFGHFRSLSYPAVFFWICQHSSDLFAILLIIMFFMPLYRVLISTILFLIYLFCRSHYEMESYIRNDCVDLHELDSTYMQDDRAHFWVAEILCFLKGDKLKDYEMDFRASPNLIFNFFKGELNKASLTKNNSQFFYGKPEFVYSTTRSSNSQTEKCYLSKLIGCIGLAPHKDDKNVAQVVRLVVSKESRRMHIGSMLLCHLEKYARDLEYKEIRFYTNNLNPASLNFVRENGYNLKMVVRRGLMRGDLLIWQKFLANRDIAINRARKSEENVSNVLD